MDQVFTAACKVVCEWANKLLGRCFNTLIELTKFLVNGSYVSTKSMAAFIVMSTTDVSIEEMNQRFVYFDLFILLFVSILFGMNYCTKFFAHK